MRDNRQMANRGEDPRRRSHGSVLMTLPPWLWGGDPSRTARAARWTITREGDAGTNTWRVTPTERRNGSRPNLLELTKLLYARNVEAAGSLSRLGTIFDAGVDAQNLSPGLMPLVRSRVGEILGSRDNVTLGRWVKGISLHISTCPSSHLAVTVREAARSIIEQFPNASVHLLRQDSAFHHRHSMMRMLLRLEEDEAFRNSAPNPDDPPSLDSARHLFTDSLLGLYSYLAPLFLSHSPHVWAFNIARPGANLIFTLGVALNGIPDYGVRLLDAFSVGRANGGPRERPTNLSSRDLEVSLAWWVRQLDELFSEIGNLANYGDADGRYDARTAFGTSLSIDQLFKNIHALLIHEADSHSRRLLCFDALDTLEGLRLLDFETMCELRTAERTLVELEALLPPEPSRVLLPRARDAVDALRELQDGFFLPSRIAEDGLLLPSKSGREEVVSLAKASAFYLRLLRNAGHGFTGKHDKGRPRDQALLASHRGVIPYALPDVAYLYLLRLVANPARLGLARQR
jgi:hypothetical protein